MGKSQETFNKKEKEKKKLKKRQDKEEKREERKADSQKGKGFDNMIAYVDEYGNITSTPPDPQAKKKIKSEDIQISVQKQEAPNPEDLIHSGKVSFFNESKGYGFIKDLQTQESFFVHINALIDPIKEGDKVSFELENGPKGPNAVRVKKVS